MDFGNTLKVMLMENKYYANDNSKEIVKIIKRKLNVNISEVSHELLCLFNDILNKEPCCFWNNSVFTQAFTQLDNLYKNHPTKITYDESVLEHFLIAYHTYFQITDVINDLSKLNDSPAIKNRLYRIPTYISIVEGCLTNLYRVIALIINQTTTKDYASINKLNPLCELLKSNGFDHLVADIDVNVRNAINHGGVIFKDNGKEIEFHYTENHIHKNRVMKYYEFETLINQAYDTASGVLLGICCFFNNHNDLLTADNNNKSFLQFSLFQMRLSIPSVRCNNISESPDGKQLNIDIYVENTDRDYIVQTAVMLSFVIYNHYSDYEKYFITFNNERLQTSWIRFFNNEICDMLAQPSKMSEVVLTATKRQDIIIFNPSTESIDLQEIKYYRYPVLTDKNFTINNIEDASLPDKKRLRAHLFIGDVQNKNDIMSIIHEAVDWLKTVKNISGATLPTKHGSMPADSLYINVYRFNARKNKELLPSSNNFVCFIDYNENGETSLVNGGLTQSIWNQLYHEKINNLFIAWREKRHIGNNMKKMK